MNSFYRQQGWTPRKAVRYCKLRKPTSDLEAKLVFVVEEEWGDKGSYRPYDPDLGKKYDNQPIVFYRAWMRPLADNEKLF